jgi:endoglycosylceramidase
MNKKTILTAFTSAALLLMAFISGMLLPVMFPSMFVKPLIASEGYMGSVTITIDGDVSDWEGIDPVYVDEIGDTQPWSTNMTILSFGNTSEAGLPGAPFDAARDLKALYVFADEHAIYVRLDVVGLPSVNWGYGGLNASMYHMYFDTDRLDGSGQKEGSSASDIEFPNSTFWERDLSWTGRYALLQDESWGRVDDTGGSLRLAQNVTLGVFELSIPRSDFPAEWDGNTLRIVVMTLKPGESYGNYGNWLHTFDPQAPGTPGEPWGNPGLPAKGGDAADVIPGGAGAIIPPGPEDWDRRSKVAGGLDVDTTPLPHGPMAYFDYSPIAPNPNDIIAFNASGSSPGWNGTHNVPIVSYEWDFGGGVTATGVVVYHNYTSEGSYTVTLTVTDSRGWWDTESKTVTVRKPLPWLHADGKWIKDEDGNIVLLRGCNYMGAEFGWFGHEESDYARMKSWGFNVVRQPISWTYIEPSRGYYDESYLRYVDKLVAWCKKYGLYMVLDMHQWNWAPKFGGNGLPEWAVAQWSTQEEAKIGFWSNETLKGYFYEMWMYVAARYANESTIAAYDLFNEANPPYLADVFYEFYNNTIKAIRTIDPKHICMYMPPWGNTDPFKKINQPNLIFSTHLYTGGTWDGVTGYNGDINMLEEDMLRGYNKAVLEWNMPLWVGEFGVGSAATMAAEWTRDMLNLMDKYMIGSAWWTYWKDEKEMGLLYPDGKEKEMFTSILDRPYPMASSAEPYKFSYEKRAYAHHFSIVLSPPETGHATVKIHISRAYNDFVVFSNASVWGYSWDLENRVLNVSITTEKACEVTVDLLVHDVAITDVTTYANLDGYLFIGVKFCYTLWKPIGINVTVRNEGSYAETFNVTAYNETTPIGTKTVIDLAPGASKTITFTWDHTSIYVQSKLQGGDPAPSYTIWAKISMIYGETDAENNTHIDGTTQVRHPGDTDGDGKCYTLDFSNLVVAFREGTKPDKPFNSPQCDFDGDKKVYTLDFSIMVSNYRWGTK